VSKKVIRNLFRPFAVAAIKARTKNVRRSFSEALKHLEKLGFYPKSIIDVGAGSGTFPLLNTFPKSEYIWIEPLVEFEEDLKKLTHRFKGKYLMAGAWKFNGKSIIHVHSDPYSSSLCEESDGKEVDGEAREIKIIMLDDLISKYSLPSGMLMKIDVQGTELDVLDGAQRILKYCEAVILEVSFFKFFKRNPEFHDVIDYMKKRNFVVYDMFDGHNRPLDGALAQKDVLFVKENGRFRQIHRWASNEQRKTLIKVRKIISKKAK